MQVVKFHFIVETEYYAETIRQHDGDQEFILLLTFLNKTNIPDFVSDMGSY